MLVRFVTLRFILVVNNIGRSTQVSTCCFDILFYNSLFYFSASSVQSTNHRQLTTYEVIFTVLLKYFLKNMEYSVLKNFHNKIRKINIPPSRLSLRSWNKKFMEISKTQMQFRQACCLLDKIYVGINVSSIPLSSFLL